MTFRGPALDSIGYKVRPGWLAAWLKDPKSYLAAVEDGQLPAVRRRDREPAGVPALAAGASAARQHGVDWKKADTANGRALFGELRCVSCHAVNGRGGTMGPELTRIGDKVRRDWLFSFLKDPHRAQPDTPMLQYRLTDDQLRDLTAFLLEEYSSADAGAEPPPVTYQDARAARGGTRRLRAPRLRELPPARVRQGYRPHRPEPGRHRRSRSGRVAVRQQHRPAHDRQLHLPEGAAARRAGSALDDADLRLHAGRRREDRAGARQHPQGRSAGVLRAGSPAARAVPAGGPVRRAGRRDTGA